VIVTELSEEHVREILWPRHVRTMSPAQLGRLDTEPLPRRGALALHRSGEMGLGAADPIGRPTSEIHHRKNANQIRMESIENGIRKAPNKPTTDRVRAHFSSLRVFDDPFTAALRLGQESDAKARALEIVITSCVVEFQFG
jgi:hypothetical protein